MVDCRASNELISSSTVWSLVSSYDELLVAMYCDDSLMYCLFRHQHDGILQRI